MNSSVLDLFTIGIGPSSSHTVGPMRAAKRFLDALVAAGHAPRLARLACATHGSLAATGRGHGTDKALVMGFLGETPEAIDPDSVEPRFAAVRENGRLDLPWGAALAFDPRRDLAFDRLAPLPLHPNGMHFQAFDTAGGLLAEDVVYSLGGGFIASEAELRQPAARDADEARLPCPFASGAELMERCEAGGLSIAGVALANENALRPEAETRARLDAVWQAMQDCVARGCRRDGVLPGGLHVKRRARAIHQALASHPERSLADPLTILDWVDLYALAVNEENAAGGRVVTAPTNGAAGILPAVLHYATRFRHSPHPDGPCRFLLAAGAIGLLYKRNASISGADVGCQGEVGVACSMAAAGLVEFLGGSPRQAEFAAEIGMEHNLGLTCDPVGGLVQIPCIERNAMAAVKALNAARMALAGDGSHYVPLDKVIATMRDTGRDMCAKYKETSRGGLAVNVVAC